MRKVSIAGSALMGVLLLAPLAVAAEGETLLYARYLDERQAESGLERLADAQAEGAVVVKAGAFIVKQMNAKLRIEKLRAISPTAGALIDGVLGVLTRSPGSLQRCPDPGDEPLTLRACPEQENAYLTLAALGVPKSTVIRIRNSFPWWYTGYTADEAAIIVVVPPEHAHVLITRLRRTQVIDIIGYAIPPERIDRARELLVPAPAAGER